MLHIGHKGADLIAPGNTFASFRAALQAGVDMIEFDVIAEHADGSGELLLAHDGDEAAARTPHTLDEGLAHFAGTAYDDVGLILDLKLAGYEQRVVHALLEHGLAERTLLSTTERSSLALLRSLHPEIKLGWSVPRVRRDPLRNPLLAVPAFVVMQYLRLMLPRAAAKRVRRGEIDAVMSHWRLVTRRLADAMHATGGELYVWTVDDARRIAELERLGVSGVISNDPRLFSPTA